MKTPPVAPVDIMQIKTGMPILCSQRGEIGVVDRVEGKESIKVNRDENGVHHYFPISWVARVDTKVYLNRPGDQAKREWSDTSHARS